MADEVRRRLKRIALETLFVAFWAAVAAGLFGMGWLLAGVGKLLER